MPQPPRTRGSSVLEPRAQDVRFRRALALCVMTLLVPGSAQFVAGDRRVGRAALWTWLILLTLGVGVGFVAWWSPFALVGLATTPSVLLALRVALIALGLSWAYLFVDAWRLGKPLSLATPQRRWAVLVNGGVALTVLASLLYGAHVVSVQRSLMLSMFSNTVATDAHDGRYNILLLGGDAGEGRTGLRPDSLTVASIDAETGRTVLISLPRNLANFRFAKGSVMAKQFPKGWTCDGCYLNAVSTWAVDHRELFGGSKTPGVDATIMAVEGITGLKVNYWAMVNLAGFKDLVDAVGGVKLNVRSRIPVGGLGSNVTGYLEPGVQVLNGHDTLWFARAREGSDDYSRMARQKCVMAAMLDQISPDVALRHFEDIASASQGMVTTNLPAKELDTFAALALKARSAKVSTVSIVPPAINTGDPDLALIKRMIADGIARAEGTTTEGAPRRVKKSKAGMTGGSYGSMGEGYLANSTEDLGASC